MMAALVAAGSACAPAPEPLERHEYSRTLMGTEARVVLYAPAERTAREAAEAAFERMSRLEDVMSDWRETSELSALGRAAGSASRPVSRDLFAVLVGARALAEASGGAFDPTVGPVVLLWREARRTGKPPAADRIDSARHLVGWRELELNPGPPPTARLARDGMRLDLGGIGKGFAAQEAVELLRARGLPRALVSLAGDVVCGDPPPGRDGWDVAIGAGGETVPLARAAISTSGDAEQFVEIGGVRHSHVVDPRTGLALTGSSWVTVTAPDGAVADALSTAASVLGDEAAARALVAKFGGARLVRFVRR
jgi:thiamine biosynthesis lipoprotein